MTKPKVSNFQILEMIANEGTADGIALCPDVVSFQKTKNGGHVTMGVPPQVIDWLMSGSHSAKLLLINIEDFKRVEAQANAPG